MAKEIERKFLFDGDIDSVLQQCTERYFIKDFYFNKYSRYRHSTYSYKFSNEWKNSLITDTIEIKSTGTLVRDEFSFHLTGGEIPEDGTYTPTLDKVRYIYNYEGHKFEINIYKDIELVMVEVELKSETELIKLPDWIGEEVTNNEYYYNKNLYDRVVSGLV